MHIFYVQGGGLGHLTRIDKLIRFLRIRIEDVLIVSPSQFTHHFKSYSFEKLPWNTSVNKWAEIIEAILLKTKVDTFYIDTFPLGIKGELIPIYKKFKTLNCIYISRILKWDFYIKNKSEAYLKIFNETILLEQLYANHLDWIKLNSKKISHIDLSSFYSSKPQINLIKEPYVLVILSGPKKDVLELCNSALKDIKNIKHPILVFTQIDIDFKNPRFIVKKNNFPVNQYFKYASHIYTGTGFNSIKELLPYKNKHTCIAFQKLYDDQFYRKKCFEETLINGEHQKLTNLTKKKLL